MARRRICYKHIPMLSGLGLFRSFTALRGVAGLFLTALLLLQVSLACGAALAASGPDAPHHSGEARPHQDGEARPHHGDHGSSTAAAACCEDRSQPSGTPSMEVSCMGTACALLPAALPQNEPVRYAAGAPPLLFADQAAGLAVRPPVPPPRRAQDVPNRTPQIFPLELNA